MRTTTPEPRGYTSHSSGETTSISQLCTAILTYSHTSAGQQEGANTMPANPFDTLGGTKAEAAMLPVSIGSRL